MSELVLEARPESLMRKDRRTVDRLRSRGGIDRALRVDHGLPSSEPMLWAADQVLGAIGEAFAGRESYFDRIEATTHISRIEL